MDPEIAPPLTTYNLDELCRAAVLMAMRESSGRLVEAAKLCGISRNAMRRRLLRYGWRGILPREDLADGKFTPAQIRKLGIERCTDCPAFRTAFELDNWPCRCGHSEVDMDGITRWPTGERQPTSVLTSETLTGLLCPADNGRRVVG